MDSIFNLVKNRLPNFLGDLVTDTAESFYFRKEANSRPVLVIPGFMANDHATLILRAALLSSGFSPYAWNKGTNVIASNKLLEELNFELTKIYERHSSPVTIIGWSMGGFYARALAQMSPDKVNSVITLGTPFKQEINLEEMREKYSKIGINIDDYPIDQKYLDLMKILPIVPFTSLYSRADMIAPFEASLERETDITENVEVMTGHFGMVCDPEALRVIIDRCLQIKETWTKYNPDQPK